MKSKMKRLSKSTVSVLLALIMVVSMIAVGIASFSAYYFYNDCIIYFDNSKMQFDADKTYVFIRGNGNYTYVDKMTAVSNTNLLYWKKSSDWKDLSSNSIWFAQTDSQWDNGNYSWSDKQNNFTKCTNCYDNYDFASKTYYITTSGSANKSGISISTTYNNTGYTAMVKDMYANVYYNTTPTSGGSYTQGGTGGTVTITARTWTGATSTSVNTANSSSSGSTANTIFYDNAVLGANVTFTATPADGYVFEGYYASESATTPMSTNPVRTYSVEQSDTVYARFRSSESRFTVSTAANPSAGGTISPTSGTAGNTTTTAQFTASANPGYTFTNWTLPSDITLASGYSLTDSTIKVKATAAGTITANFTEKATQDVTITAPTNGSVTVSGSSVSGSGSVTVASGGSNTTFQAHVDDVLTITATPAEGTANYGYKLKSLTVADQAITSGSTYTVVAGTDPTVTATFVQTDTYRIKVFAGSGGETKMTIDDGDEVTISPNQAQNFDVPWAKGYTVSWASGSGNEFSGVTKNGAAISGATDNSNATGTHADAGAVYKTSFTASWPPVSGYNESTATAYIWVATNQTLTDNKYEYYCNSSSAPYKVLKNGNKYWISLSDANLTAVKKSNSNFYVGFATTSNYNDIATSATVNIASGYNFAINGSGVQGQNFGNDSDEEKIARYHTNSTDYNDITHIGILVDNTNSSKPTYTIYSSGNSTTGDVNFDPFYLGGRFTINNGTADVSAGNDKWNFSMNSTNIKWTKDAATGYYKLATNKTIAQLSPMKNDDGTGGYTDQLFIVHDTVNKYSIYNGAYSGHNFQDNLGEANALTLTNTETNPLSKNELMFDDLDNTSNGKVIIWIDADNYAEGNANSRLKIWYTLENETPAVAEKLSFSISPASVMEGSSATLTATLTGVDSSITSTEDVVFTFTDARDVQVSGTPTVTKLSDGRYRATLSVTNAEAGDYTYKVTVDPANGAALRSVTKSVTGTWKPQTVYYTNDITDDASAPTWTGVNTTSKFATIPVASLDEGEEYTFALSDTEAYNPDFADFEIATEYNQFCDITMSHKTVTIDGEDRVVRTYVVTPRTNCSNPVIYINAETKKVYAVATYDGDTSSKTSAEDKRVTYYFAERSNNVSQSNPKDSHTGLSTNEGMRIHYWNNSVSSLSGTTDVYTKVIPTGKSTNAIHVDTSALYNNDDNTATDATFYVYSVELPVWATSFQFLTSSSTDSFNAEPTYTIDYTSKNHSITLNPNRIYLLYQDNSTWKVQGVILDETMWETTANRKTNHYTDANEVATKGFTANLIDYKNISGLENQNNGINSHLQTLYNSSNYNTPNALYFGYISSRQSWTGMSTDKLWAQSNAQRNNANSYYASIQNMVGATLTTNGKSVGSKGTYDSKSLNANGFGLMLDTRNDNTNGIKNSNLMPLFDYTALAADSDAASLVKQGLSFPFYESTYNGITTFSYDSTTDRNRVYDSTTQNFAIQGAKGTSTAGYRNYYAYGKDSDDKGYVGYFPFGGNTDKYSNTGFATEFDLNFYMTNSGYLIDSKDVAQDIAFNFSGDDDVWVYVDGVKVLDLGGDHKVSAASINFSQGKVYYKSAANSIANVEGCTDAWASSGDYVKTVDLVKLMASYGVDFSATDASTKHTFQMFYMERGAFQSNCVISFNLPQASGLNVRNTVTADHVNNGLKDAALAASNTDYFTYGVGNALVGSNAPIETLKGKGGIYAKALLPSSTADWSFVTNTPLYPYFYDITRVFGGKSLVLSSSSGSGQAGSDNGPNLNTDFQGLKGTVYTLSDRYAQSEDEGAKLSGKTDTSTGNFHLLGGEMANFADKVRPNSYVQVKQTQLLGKAEPNTSNYNIIEFNEVDDNNVGNYYVTSYDIYDEAAKKNVVDKTPYDIKFGDSDVYYATDLSAPETGFYFTNYAGDSSNINPAMTVNFYNDIAVGDLIISKQVTGTNTAKDNFVFKVQFANIFGNGDENWTEYNVDYRVYNMEDDTPVTDAVQSYGSVGIVIKPGQYAKIEGIPVETRFKVTELERAGYSVANIDKTAVKPDNSQITCKGNNQEGFYNYVQQGATTVTKDDSYNDSGFIYYCNMIPTVAETLVSGTNYVSTSTVAYANKKDDFTIQFKYYDRREIDGTTAGINSSFSSYSKPVDSMDGYINYVGGDPTQEVQSIDFARMIGNYATAFATDTLIDNVMCDYNMWTTQQAAETAMANKTYFDSGEEIRYDATTQAPYHTDYLGRPSTSGEKWVNYYDGKGNPVELTNQSLATEYLKVRSIVVWCYNYPKQYDVDVYGAKSSSDLNPTAKTVGDKNVYVADASTTTSKSVDNNFYYNQRFGTEVANADDLNAAGFISNYGIPGVYSGNLCPQDYAADTIDNYKFAYWAFDPDGTQLASTDIKYKYRVTKNTKLYAVYTTPEALGEIGLSLSANDNDTYVDSGGVSRTRLNIMANVYNAEDYDPNIKKLAFVNITLSNQIRDDIANNTGYFTPAKINWLFNEYKEQLKTIIKLNEAHATFSGEKDGGKHTYTDTAELNLTLTTKGYIYTVTSNGNPLGAGEAEMKLTNKNRGQFTIAYKTSALNVGNTNPNGATCLMYSGAVLHTGTGDVGDVWDISDNCLIYYNGAVVDNTAETWPNA